MKNHYLIILLSAIILSGCSSGKRSLERGDYDRAVYQAVKRLQQNPDSRKANHILPIAYKSATQFHLSEITRFRSMPASMSNLDGVVQNYENLNSLYNAIMRCPRCIKVLGDIPHYQTELANSRFDAAKYAYEMGVDIMDRNPDVLKAREAYRLFSKVKGYQPDFQQVDSWLNKSLDLGTLRVMIDDIPFTSTRLQLSTDFFMNQIQEYARNLNYTFVQFYSRQEAERSDIAIDQVIDIYFDDFVVGQTFVKETVNEVSRDSVVTGTITNEDGSKTDIYGTVKAEMHVFRKTVTSTGLLNMSIVDAVNRNVLQQRKFPGTFVWEWDWGYYNGDERALTEFELDLSNRREIPPPPPQELFIQFTRPIFGQVSSELRRYYSAHQ
jgi:hypothetical protein